MIVNQCYGHNVYIDEEQVGYISPDGEGDAVVYVSGRKFAFLSSSGSLGINGKEVGYIDDVGDVYLNGKLAGEITSNNDIRFYSSKLR